MSQWECTGGTLCFLTNSQDHGHGVSALQDLSHVSTKFYCLFKKTSVCNNLPSNVTRSPISRFEITVVVFLSPYKWLTRNDLTVPFVLIKIQISSQVMWKLKLTSFNFFHPSSIPHLGTSLPTSAFRWICLS